MATNISASTTANLKQNLGDFCEQYPDVLFETLDTAVPYIANAALNVASAIVAIFGNMFIFQAIRSSKSIHFPSKLLLFTLFLTDFGAGLVAQPLYAALLIMKARALDVDCTLAKLLIFVAPVLSCVSLLTMVAITLDRYIAVFFHSKYHEIVTAKRIYGVLTVIILLGIANGSTRLLNQALFNYTTLVAFVICVFIISVADIKIYRWLRQQNDSRLQMRTASRAQSLIPAGKTTKVAMYRRLASTMMWIYVVFVGCYAPYFCVLLITKYLGSSALMQCIREFFYTLLLCNSSFNPFVYCFRLPEIRAEVIKLLRKLFIHNPPATDDAILTIVCTDQPPSSGKDN